MGSFVTANGSTRNRVARFNVDGTLDTAFNPNVGITGDSAECVTLQADGKLIIGGEFERVGGSSRNNLARLNPNGTLDTSFNPNVDGVVLSTSVQCDGRIIVGGNFTVVRGVSRRNLARLNPDGSLDGTFDSSGGDPNGSIYHTGIQADGKVIIAGYFGTVKSVEVRGIARLLNTPATQSLSVIAPDCVRWLRGGSSPETDYVTFDLSLNDGKTWMPLGEGTRITGGWSLNGLSLPSGGRLRARARNCAGSSVGLIQSTVDFVLAPEIVIHNGTTPAAPELTNEQSVPVDFGVARQGTPLFRYVTIRNTGNADLVVDGVTLPVGYSTPQSFPMAIAAGDIFRVQLFLNAATPGSFAGTIGLDSNDVDESLFRFPVTGTVVTPEIVLRDGGPGAPELLSGQPEPLSFGTVRQSAPQEAGLLPRPDNAGQHRSRWRAEH